MSSRITRFSPIPEEFRNCIENIRWWTSRIKGFENLDVDQRIEFIDYHAAFYSYCQEILYKNEDPYHLGDKTLPLFLFYHYFDSRIDVITWLYDTYEIGLPQRNRMDYTVLKKGYLPTLEWMVSNHLFRCENGDIEHCFRQLCMYGYLAPAQKMYDVLVRNEHSITDYVYYECHRLAKRGLHIEVVEWLLTLEPVQRVLESCLTLDHKHTEL